MTGRYLATIERRQMKEKTVSVGELEDILGRVKEARTELIACISGLQQSDLDASRRGGWTVRQVIDHIVDSERQYGLGIGQLRGQGTQTAAFAPSTSLSDALHALRESRRVLLAAAEGVDEETFYRIGRLGHQEYSVLSILENVEQHDREHRAQIERIASRE